MSDADIKQALKEALKEWLDEKFSEFGYWSFRALLGAGLTGLVYFFLQVYGWHKN